MKGKAAKIALLMLLTFTMVPIVYAIDFTTGIYFEGASGGLITFDHNFVVSQMKVGSNVFSGLVLNRESYGVFGFDVSAGANMTITKIGADEIDYTVNAPTSTISTTKIYVGAKGKPTNVTGGSSWSYNKNLKTVSIDVEHHSPAYIVIEWHQDIVQEYINRTYPPIVEMFGVVLIVMACVLIFSAMNGTPIDTNTILDMLLIAIILSLGAYVLTYFTF